MCYNIADMDERRRSKRYPIAYPVELSEGGGLRPLELVDISRGGIAFNDTSGACRDATVDLRLFLKTRSFALRAMVVYARKLKDGLYSMGAKFLNVPNEFPGLLEDEAERITQFHRECNLYRHRGLSFKKASSEYLSGTPDDPGL